MKNRPLLFYFIILVILCVGMIAGMLALAEQTVFLVQAYMLTPAIAAIITRAFFYEHKFKDANLRFGKWDDYLKFWAAGIAITLLSYAFFTLLGSISWDFSGVTFLDNLAKQFAMGGQDIQDTLPPGFTPEMMLWLFFAGGLTVFNIMLGLITGFGEEFGHRGLMFPLLYRIHPFVGFVIGGLLWYAWHLPLALVSPVDPGLTLSEILGNHLVLAIGSICTFIYLAFVYVRSSSIFVAAIAHITLNNAAVAFSYFVTVENQLMANIGLTLTMLVVVASLYLRGQLQVFSRAPELRRN
ncbi:MAG TPA: CPBP family intramembrane glutamic endopeptidase [Anaerolineales bacterium]|nr:CPBP family intramembrane glutamic endopeptidase [Anaerolineales bacterium]